MSTPTPPARRGDHPPGDLDGPFAIDRPAKCGWILGFPDGGACTKPAAGTWCKGHERAERRIAAKTLAIARRSATLLSEDKQISVKALRAAGNPRVRAEEWWLKVGVRQIPQAVREKALGVPYVVRCTYCGGRWAEVIDHVLPVAQGGLSESENLAAACWSCNAAKSDATPTQWRARRIEEGLCWPPESWTALVDRAVTAMMEDDPPPSFLADVVYDPCWPEDLPADSPNSDPRYLRAHEALREDRPDLTARESWLRKRAAILVCFWVELEYELDVCGGCGIPREVHGSECGLVVMEPDAQPAQWVTDLGVTEGALKETPLLLADRRTP